MNSLDNEYYFEVKSQEEMMLWITKIQDGIAFALKNSTAEKSKVKHVEINKMLRIFLIAYVIGGKRKRSSMEQIESEPCQLQVCRLWCCRSRLDLDKPWNIDVHPVLWNSQIFGNTSIQS
jgi:hypothetical protein